MKKLFLLPILLLSLISTSCWGVEWNDLVKRDGLYYKKFTDTPFTGKVSGEEQGKMKNGIREGKWIEYYRENGQLYEKGSYKNGKREGEWVEYHKYGQLKRKGSYKNGKEEGKWIEYFTDGQLMGEGSFKNGEGEWIEYFMGGQLRSKGSLKNGEEEGEWVSYYSNGQLNQKGSFKDGKKEGKVVTYNFSGTIVSDWTGTFKNGKKISD